MPFYVINKDITTFDTDAIVNSANVRPIVADGVEEQIYLEAGLELLTDRKAIGVIPTGESVISKGYNLQAKYVIHTVAPVYDDYHFDSLLSKAYLSALKMAKKNELTSIAFPLLSAGTNGCPRDKAIEIAIDSITRFLQEYDIGVYLVLYEPYHSKGTLQLSREIRNYIDEFKIEKRREHIHSKKINQSEEETDLIHSKIDSSLECDFDKLSETFQERLFKAIVDNGIDDVNVYKRANISRKLFSKIRSDKTYQPNKRTVIALAIALKLNLEKTRDLLEAAGYSLTRSIEFDLMIIFFIEKKMYDIMDINLILHEYQKPLLGSK